MHNVLFDTMLMKRRKEIKAQEIEEVEPEGEDLVVWPSEYFKRKGDVFRLYNEEIDGELDLSDYIMSHGKKPGISSGPFTAGKSMWHDVDTGNVYVYSGEDSSGQPIWSPHPVKTRYACQIETAEVDGKMIAETTFLGVIENSLMEKEANRQQRINEKMAELTKDTPSLTEFLDQETQEEEEEEVAED